MIFVVLLVGIFPSALLLSAKVKCLSFYEEVWSRLKLLLSYVGILLLLVMLFYSNYASVSKNNRELAKYLTPFTLIDSMVKYVKENAITPPLPFTIIDASPELKGSLSHPHIVVLLLGQTARQQNFSLNGYARETNPLTGQQNVASFTNVKGCATYKSIAIPCMFSRLDRIHFDKRKASHQQNVLDILQLAGVDVSWISNVGNSCKGACVRINHETVPMSDTKFCDNTTCFDEVLLTILEEKIESLKSKNTLIVLHSNGSRGPAYFERYPKRFRLFKPDCQRRDIQNCSDEQLLNAYDNSIVYADYIIAEIIERLTTLHMKQGVDVSFLYLSDHGESLGEKGIYLHGLPYFIAPREQIEIPFVVKTLGKKFNPECIERVTSNPYSHDNVFDSLIGLFDIKTVTYNSTKDILAECRF